MGRKKARWQDPENKNLLPTAWVAIGKALGAIDLAGGGVNSVTPCTKEVLALDENSELELSHPGSAAKGIKGDTTAIGKGDTIRCIRCNGTQVYSGYKGDTWMPGCGAKKDYAIRCSNKVLCGIKTVPSKWAVVPV
jgi:hypothetical protein